MKKLFLIFVYSIFLGHLLLAQDSTTTDAPKKPKWALHLLFSRDYDYRYIHQIKELPAQNNFYGYYYTIDDQIPKMGWHTATLVSYHFVKHLFVQFGFIVDRKGYDTKTLTYAEFNKYGQIIQYYYGTYKNNYYFIGIPILINGEVPLTKRLYATIGLGINYYFSEIDKIESSGGIPIIDAGTSLLSNAGTSFNGTIGLTYYTKQNVILSLKPTCTFFLTSFHDDGLGDYNWYYKNYLYSFGVEFGLGFGLGKR